MSCDEAGTPAQPAPTAQPAPPRGRSVLVTLGIVFGILVVVGAVVGFVVYDRATAIDRSTPVVSADAFLHAALVESSVVRVGLYTCRGWAAAEAMAATVALTDTQARVSWDTFEVVSRTDDAAMLTARIRFQYPGEVAPSGEATWRLDLANEDGWRVCGVAEST